ncbi:MAG: hypothetical protein V4685_09540 [Bacteroidota bacterium]
MKKRFFVPSFLQQFDTWLLKHKPAAWSARTHLLLYYTIIFSAIITLFSFLSFSDARQRSDADVWSGFTGLAAFTAFVFWLIFLLRFNVFKRFGNWKKGEGLQMFGLYFINVAALVFTAFIPYMVECINANRAYNDYELVNDINEINLTACQLDYNILPKKFKIDTLELVKADTTKHSNVILPEEQVTIDSVVTAEYDEAAAPAEYRVNYSHTSDTSNFYARVNGADSSKKISDSVYVFFDCPEYIFARSYQAEQYGKVESLSSFEIYNKVVKNYKQPDKAALLKKMKQFDDKYATEHPDYSDHQDKTYNSIIEKKYYINEINWSIENIARKKYWWESSSESITRFFWYITLVITLLVFIFRSTTVKTFFLSLLAAVILLIGTGIIIGVFRIYDKGTLIFILSYYLLFLITSFSIKAASVRNALQGIALNFTVFLTVFIPLAAVSLYFEFLQDMNINHQYDYILHEKRNLYSFYAEVTGVVLLLILIEPVFRKLYKRWLALPEE